MKRTFKNNFLSKDLNKESHCTDGSPILDHIYLESVQISRQVMVRELLYQSGLVMRSFIQELVPIKSQIGPEKVLIFPEKAMSAKSMKSMQYKSPFWLLFG